MNNQLFQMSSDGDLEAVDLRGRCGKCVFLRINENGFHASVVNEGFEHK